MRKIWILTEDDIEDHRAAAAFTSEEEANSALEFAEERLGWRYSHVQEITLYDHLDQWREYG